MKKLILAALLAGVTAAPANASYIIASLTADVTWTNPNPPGLSSQYVGLVGQSFQGDPSGLLDYTSGTPFDISCTECLIFTVTGRNVQLALLPYFHKSYGGYLLTLYFDRDLNGDILNIASASLIGGTLISTAGGSGTSSSFGGPVVSFSAFVPEPSTWALMVGGFALAGATLRRPKVRLAL
jgi:hypothetical protein